MKIDLLPKLSAANTKKYLGYLIFLSMLAVLITVITFYLELQKTLKIEKTNLTIDLNTSKNELINLQNQDQIKINKSLQDQIAAINKTYIESIGLYEKLTDLKAQKIDTSKLDPIYAKAVRYVADKNYSSGSATLSELSTKIDILTPKVISTPPSAAGPVANAPQNNTPPGSGYSLQAVSADGQTYNVVIIAADLNSTKVIVDSASDSDCSNNCPVMTLADYVSRSGAYAGINGSFFCPSDYPSCSNKAGSFDTLLMNKNKHYFNSDNNVYSNIPAVIFSSGSIRFVGQSLQWGRDTGVDGVIANYPLLIAGGNINFTEDPNEPKFGAKGARSFIANRDNTVYIGVIFNATMGESAKVLHALGMTNALNLDEGGSTALYSGGYKAGPGRNIPNAVLFVKR